MSARVAATYWAVCPDYAAGPYRTADDARRLSERYDCSNSHAVVQQVTRPVIPERDEADEPCDCSCHLAGGEPSMVAPQPDAAEYGEPTVPVPCCDHSAERGAR